MSHMQAKGKLADLLFFNLTRTVAFITLSLLGGIVISLTWSAWPSIEKFGLGFLTSSAWNPPAEDFGALVPIYGTIVTSLIALAIALPISACTISSVRRACASAQRLARTSRICAA